MHKLIILLRLFKLLNNSVKKNYLIQLSLNTFITLLEPLLIISVGIIFFIIFNDPNEYVNNNYLVFLKDIPNIPKIFDHPKYILFFIVLLYFGINVLNILVKLRKFYFTFIAKSFLSNKIFSNFLNKNWEFHTSISKSTITKQIKNDTARVIDGILTGSLDFVDNVIKIFIIFCTLIVVDLKISLSVIAILGIFFLFIIICLNKSNMKIGQKITDLDGANYKRIMNSLIGIKNIIIKNNQDFFINYFKTRNNDLLKLQMLKKIYLTLPGDIFKILIFSLLITFLLIMKEQNQNFFKEYAFILGVFIYGTNKISSLLVIVYKNITNFTISTHSFEKLDNYIEKDFTNIHNKYVLKAAESEKLNFTNLKLKNIFFSYSNTYSDVKNISLEIHRNQIIGITGKTGSGKSTIIDIVLQLLDYTSGEILFNDTKIDKSNKQNLQSLMSYASQDSFFIEGSIIDNITFGHNDKNINLKKIERLIKIVGLNDFVSKLKNNLNTIISENGNNLSSGEKQRIVIARMLYDDKQLIILDEATNALDFDTEKKLLNNITKMDKTVLIISHSKKILDFCDKVYVLEKGQISTKHLKAYFNEET